MQSLDQQADDAYAVAVLNRVDNFAPLRNGLRRVAHDRREWAGIPMPLDGNRLVIEPTYPGAKELSDIGAPAEGPEDDCKIINSWWSTSKRGTVYVYEQDGRRKAVLSRYAGHHFNMDFLTMGCAVAWGIEQEHKAVSTLGTLLRHHMFKTYLLTGMFIETSKRSRLMYVFRRLKPTVVLSMRKAEPRIIATLCLHPIAYYAGTWAGAMTPTDDVVAHLMLMRGDEAMFWRRSNQHPAWRPEAGL